MINETNDSFPFSNLTLCKPLASSSGGFFIRYSFKEQPLYIQPPKCYIKQIHAKTGKKMYCDLVFKQENEAFLQWMEHLESQTQQHLYDNRLQWFQTDLEKEDIEQSFTSPVKIYKSGKEYIVRTNIPSRAGNSILKIYDEDEKTVPLEDIVENTKVMVILEIQGVRSSSKSFQVDIEVKQMMVMKPEEIFNTCIFKKKVEPFIEEKESFVPEVNSPLPEVNSPVPEVNSPLPEVNSLLPEVNSPVPEAELDIEEPPLEEIKTESLCEVELDLDEKADTVALKERKELYYQMYEEARQKAKVARDLALSAYLEANQIKNKYMLDDVLDSSSDDSNNEESNEEYNE